MQLLRIFHCVKFTLKIKVSLRFMILCVHCNKTTVPLHYTEAVGMHWCLGLIIISFCHVIPDPRMGLGKQHVMQRPFCIQPTKNMMR